MYHPCTCVTIIISTNCVVHLYNLTRTYPNHNTHTHTRSILGIYAYKLLAIQYVTQEPALVEYHTHTHALVHT